MTRQVWNDPHEPERPWLDRFTTAVLLVAFVWFAFWVAVPMIRHILTTYPNIAEVLR